MLNFAAWLWIQMATQLFSLATQNPYYGYNLKTSIYEVNFLSQHSILEVIM